MIDTSDVAYSTDTRVKNNSSKRKHKVLKKGSKHSSSSATVANSSLVNPSKPSSDVLKMPPPVNSVPSSSLPRLSSFRRSPLVNALHLSLSFCLIFLAFSVAQNSQTSLDPKVGAIGLGILYAVFTLSNTFSAWVVAVTNVRLCLFFGALTYALYVAANIHTVPILLYASSAVIGFGAAILWTAQGGFIAACAGQHELENRLALHSTMGWFNGIFFSIFQVNQFIGNLLAALLYTYSASQALVFSVMTVICGCGVATLLLLPKANVGSENDTARKRMIEKEEEGAEEEENVEEEESVVPPPRDYSVGAVLSSLLLLRDLRLLLLLPLIIYSGFSQSWIFGAFPPLIPGNQQKFFVLAFLGAMDAASSYSMGKLSDRVGRLPILLLGFIAHFCVFGWIVFGYSPAIVRGANPDPGKSNDNIIYMNLPLVWFFVLALLLGLGDGVFNTQVYAILGTFFKSKAEAAFANFKLFQSLSTAIFYFYLYFTDIHALPARTIIPLACMSIGMVLVIYCNVLYPFERKKDIESEMVEEGSNGTLNLNQVHEDEHSEDGTSSSREAIRQR